MSVGKAFLPCQLGPRVYWTVVAVVFKEITNDVRMSGVSLLFLLDGVAPLSHVQCGETVETSLAPCHQSNTAGDKQLSPERY